MCVCGPIYVTESRVACVSVSETTDLHPRKCNSRTHARESKRKNLHLKVLCVCVCVVVVVSSRVSPSCLLVLVRASLQQQQQQQQLPKARAVLNSKYQKVSVISAIWQHFCLYFLLFLFVVVVFSHIVCTCQNVSSFKMRMVSAVAEQQSSGSSSAAAFGLILSR